MVLIQNLPEVCVIIEVKYILIYNLLTFTRVELVFTARKAVVITIILKSLNLLFIFILEYVSDLKLYFIPSFILINMNY